MRIGSSSLPPLADSRDDEVGFITLVVGRIQFDGFALGAAGPERLSEPSAVIRNQRIGGVKNEVGGMIVLPQRIQLRLREILPELMQILHARTAPAVDGLIVIADNARRAR